MAKHLFTRPFANKLWYMMKKLMITYSQKYGKTYLFPGPFANKLWYMINIR